MYNRKPYFPKSYHPPSSMKLNEYNSKRLFKKHGIPIPDGELAKTPQEAREIAGRIGKPVVIKAQVLVGGRGKAGGVKLAKSGDEAEIYAQQILGMTIKGLRVRTVLVDEAINLAHEVYLGIVLDRAAKTATMMASAAGGMDIEEVARTQPEKIKRVVIRPEAGLYPFQARSLAFALGLDKALVNDFAVIAIQLSEVFFRYDATLAEINPLVITGASSPQLDLIAADGKIIVDDNALFRQPECCDIFSRRYCHGQGNAGRAPEISGPGGVQRGCLLPFFLPRIFPDVEEPQYPSAMLKKRNT